MALIAVSVAWTVPRCSGSVAGAGGRVAGDRRHQARYDVA